MLTHTTMKTKPTGQSLLMAVFDLRLRFKEVKNISYLYANTFKNSNQMDNFLRK